MSLRRGDMESQDRVREKRPGNEVFLCERALPDCSSKQSTRRVILLESRASPSREQSDRTGLYMLDVSCSEASRQKRHGDSLWVLSRRRRRNLQENHSQAVSVG